MWLSEKLLYLLAKALYRSHVCLSASMKEGLSSLDKYDQYRSERTDTILTHARRFGIDFKDKTVLDFGCGDGAITPHYLGAGARQVIGVDIDEKGISRAREKYSADNVTFYRNALDSIPLEDTSVDVIVSYDVFEHVSYASALLSEFYRLLRNNGKVLIGTWGWYHPFAPHLFSTMPVPWAHVFFSEKTVLRACRRVYNSSWYVPTMHDLDETGKKRADKYLEEEIPLSYVNKLFIKDFERIFRASQFRFEMYPLPFGSKYAQWTKVFLRNHFLREFVTSYLWVVLHKTNDGGGNPSPPVRVTALCKTGKRVGAGVPTRSPASESQDFKTSDVC
jgi:SAM-dependent methyltransferase